MNLKLLLIKLITKPETEFSAKSTMLINRLFYSRSLLYELIIDKDL